MNRKKFTFSTAVISLLLFFTVNIFAQLTDYKGEMNIRVKNISGTPVNNTQILLRVNTQFLISMGLMQNDGRDIRFGGACNGSPAIDYWVEGYLNTDSTKIWVKIPAIPANDSIMIYMFFGNSAASSNSSLTIFNGPNSSIDSLTGGTNGAGVANAQRGFRFSPTTDLLVTHFGKNVPTATSRVITIFDVNTC